MAEVELVQAIWNDACQVRSRKEAKALRMMSFGFLLQDDQDGVIVAQSQSDVGEFIDCLFIPRGMVLEIVKIPVPAGRGSLVAVLERNE